MFTKYPTVFEGFGIVHDIEPHGHYDEANDTTSYHMKDSDGNMSTLTPDTDEAHKALLQGRNMYYGIGDDTDTLELVGTYKDGEIVGDYASVFEIDALRNIVLADDSTHDQFLNTLQPLGRTNFSSYLMDNVKHFLEVATEVNDNSEISAVNHYVKTLQLDENDRLKKLNQKLSNNVMTTKQMYMMVNRDAHRIRSNIRMILYSMAFAAIVMAMMPYNNTSIGKAGIALAVIVFFVYVVLYVRYNKSRRHLDFNKFFFPKGDLSDVATAETTEDEDEENGVDGECPM